MSEVRFRPAESADMGALDHALSQLADELGDPHRADEESLAAAAFGTEPAFRATLAEGGDGLVGAVVYSPVFSTMRGAAGVFVSDLWISPECRGARLGARLLREAAREGASRWRAGYLKLAVYHSNDGAQRFYARIGFRDASRERALILEPPGFDDLRNI